LDRQQYIESGILELYAAGALSPEEMAEVERRAASDPVIAQEIREIRETLAMLDRHHSRAPRPEMRASVLAAIDREDAAGDSPVAVGEPNVLPIGSTRLSPRYLLAASWALVALSFGAAAYFGAQWRSAVAEVEALREDNRRLATANSQIASRAETAEQALMIMRGTDYHAVQLAGTEHAPHAHPVVYWNPKSREVHVVAKNLPAPPPGKQYQLWAIRGDERIDAGVLDVRTAADSIQRLKDVEAAEAFAVTLEPAGGSPQPTLDAIFALGKL
jgi:anti-sigma-K factor RskA